MTKKPTKKRSQMTSNHFSNLPPETRYGYADHVESEKWNGDDCKTWWEAALEWEGEHIQEARYLAECNANNRLQLEDHVAVQPSDITQADRDAVACAVCVARPRAHPAYIVPYHFVEWLEQTVDNHDDYSWSADEYAVPKDLRALLEDSVQAVLRLHLPQPSGWIADQPTTVTMGEARAARDSSREHQAQQKEQAQP